MNEPVRIVSDLHLGHKISRVETVESLRPLIAGAGTLIFNGDTWQELATPFLDRSTTMLEELKSLCEDEGAEPVFLSGNHDPGWPGSGWVDLAGGQIIVTHGDALLYGGSPWKREILLSKDRVAGIWNAHPAADSDISQRIEVARVIARDLCSVEYPHGRRFVDRAWDAMVPPQRAVRMLEAWCTQGSAGAAFCERYFPNSRTLVIGHFHREGCWLRNGRRVINTGSFTSPGPAHWVEWNDGWLSRGVIDETPGACRKGHALDVWRL